MIEHDMISFVITDGSQSNHKNTCRSTMINATVPLYQDADVQFSAPDARGWPHGRHCGLGFHQCH